MASGLRDLVLVGGGHAHALVLAAFARRPLPRTRLRLVSDAAQAYYSGMVPGFVAGLYPKDALSIDLESLVARAGGRLLPSAAVRISPAARTLETADGTLLSYDVLSLDIGATVSGGEVPGMRTYALPARPLASLIEGLPALVTRARESGGSFTVSVVGGGAGGVELACALRARFLAEGVRDGRVSILEASRELLPKARRSLARAVTRRCRALGIEVLTGVRVVAVEPGALKLDGGRAHAFDGLIWCTGAAALPLARESALPVDARGYLRVGPTLQSVTWPNLFGAGDVVVLEHAPETPRAGVYAVRAAPVLAWNLRAQLQGAPLRRYQPQRDFLSLLNFGNGRAIGAKWGMHAEGRAVFRLKDRIDRRFVARFRAGTRDPGDGPGHRASDPSREP